MPKVGAVDSGSDGAANYDNRAMRWDELSSRQHGVVSRAQLLAAGYTAGQVDSLQRGDRLATTRWPGVYRAAGAPLTPSACRWASVLDAKAVLSYLSAAAWWDLPVEPDGRIHVTVPGRRRTLTPRGVRVHRVLLADEAVSTRFGMPITVRTETILDCLGWLPLRTASTLADRCLQQRWLTRDDMRRRLDRQPGRWGNRQLALLVQATADGAQAESERRLLRLLRDSGMGGWVPNLAVLLDGQRFVLDVAFPARRLAIEVDGWAHHSGVDRFRADRRKQNALVAAGWTVLRFTWWDLVERPQHVVRAIAQLLAA